MQEYEMVKTIVLAVERTWECMLSGYPKAAGPKVWSGKASGPGNIKKQKNTQKTEKQLLGPAHAFENNSSKVEYLLSQDISSFPRTFPAPPV